VGQKADEVIERMLPGGLDVFVHDPEEFWTGTLLQCSMFGTNKTEPEKNLNLNKKKANFVFFFDNSFCFLNSFWYCH